MGTINLRTGKLYYNPETGQMTVRDIRGELAPQGLHEGDMLKVFVEERRAWFDDVLSRALDGEWCLPGTLLKGRALNGIEVKIMEA